VPEPVTFSDELEQWLGHDREKTLGDLVDVFEERSFAIAFLLLMFPSALPLPTGGVTHVLELLCLVFALEAASGRRSVWLPRRLRQRALGASTEKKAIPFIIRRVRWFERWSKPRLVGVLEHRVTRSVLGVFVLVFTLAAFVAPPFSGLDTLPSLGVVVLALGLLLHDVVVTIVGIVVGLAGVALLFVLGSVVLDFFGVT
jgi:hypothetical protein